MRMITAVGGVLSNGTETEVVERTLLTTRSIEFDALVIAGAHDSGHRHKPALLQEAYRHCKLIAAWGASRL